MRKLPQKLGVCVKLGERDSIRSDNGPEFIAKAVQAWITAVGAQTACITPGSTWDNGYIESFNARLRDEFLNGEIFYTLQEAKVLIEVWRGHDNTHRPHSSIGYRPPAPEVLLWPVPPAALNGALPAPINQSDRFGIEGQAAPNTLSAVLST